MHYIPTAMYIRLPHGVLREGPDLYNQTGVIYIVYCIFGSTVGAGWHDPK